MLRCIVTGTYDKYLRDYHDVLAWEKYRVHSKITSFTKNDILKLGKKFSPLCISCRLILSYYSKLNIMSL